MSICRLFIFLKKIPKLEFSIPKKNSILIFDDIEHDKIATLLNKKKLYFIKARSNSYNFFALLYAAIFSFRSNFKIEYLNFFFIIANTNILITTSFKRLIIYQIKNFYPDRKILIIQNGLFGNQFLNLIKNSRYNNLKCDYFFCFSKIEIQKLKKLINANFQIIGSFRSNYFSLKKKNISNSIVYISQYRKNLLKNKNFKYLYFTESKLLPILFNFCRKNKIVLKILPGENDFNREYIHYKKILKSNQFVLYKKDIQNSYRICDNSKMCVGIDSTLVFESISRGNKVAFFNFNISDNYDISLISKRYFNLINEKFWSKSNDENKIYETLKYIYFLDKKIWKREYLNNILMIPYYEQNKKIIKILSNILENK